jgi:hypothetical protein
MSPPLSGSEVTLMKKFFGKPGAVGPTTVNEHCEAYLKQHAAELN